MFKIEDTIHGDYLDGKFQTFDMALEELIRISRIPYGQEPNVAPCSNAEGCERDYHILQYDDSSVPWKLLSDVDLLVMSPKGAKWVLPCASSKSVGHELSSALSWLVYYGKEMRKFVHPTVPTNTVDSKPLVQTFDEYMKLVGDISPEFYETFGGNK